MYLLCEQNLKSGGKRTSVQSDSEKMAIEKSLKAR